MNMGTYGWFLLSISRQVIVFTSELLTKPKTDSGTYQFTNPATHTLNTLVHLRHSSFSGSSQVLDLVGLQNTLKTSYTVIHLFYNMVKKQTIAQLTLLLQDGDRSGVRKSNIPSSDRLFESLWWLEREAAENFGLTFVDKEDHRNLLLEYMNVFKPGLKAFPSWGTFEVYFHSILKNLFSRYPQTQQI